MDKLDIILTVMIAGFGLMMSLMLIMWNNLNSRIDKISEEIKDLRKDVQDLDRRLCRLEGAFSAKEFCVIKTQNELPKAE